MDIEIVDAPEKHRYEARADGQVIGFSAYRRRPDALVVTHTEVDDAYEGRGVGSALARGLLDDIRAHGGRVVPLCPFLAAYLKRHPEYADLVVTE